MSELYLVTGAAGNLGGSVTRELADMGKRVRAFVLPGDKAADNIPQGVEICYGDVLNTKDIARFFLAKSDTELYVIHCAGIVSINWRYDPVVRGVNVTGTRNVVEQCIASKVKKLVYVSSVHAIPELPKGQTIEEVGSFDPDKIVGFYGKTKAEASQIVLDAAKNRGLNASLVFPSGLCGPNDYAKGHVTQLLIDSVQGRLPAGIRGGYDFVDVRDVAKGIIACCEKGSKGEGYILGNRYVTVREIFHQVHEATGKREVKNMIPGWLAKLFVPFLNLYSAMMGIRPLFTKYSLYAILSNSEFSSKKAKRELGYNVRPFGDTVRDTLLWLKREGLISY
jgi:dihydroflavonol-4-reductase